MIRGRHTLAALALLASVPVAINTSTSTHESKPSHNMKDVAPEPKLSSRQRRKLRKLNRRIEKSRNISEFESQGDSGKNIHDVYEDRAFPYNHLDENENSGNGKL